MEAVIIFLVMASPPFVAALLLFLLRKWRAGFILALCLLLSPILYPLWVSRLQDIDHSALSEHIPGFGLIVLCTSLVISCLGWVRKAWLRMVSSCSIHPWVVCESIYRCKSGRNSEMKQTANNLLHRTRSSGSRFARALRRAGELGR